MTHAALMILFAAGAVHAADPVQPQLAPRGTMPSEHVAHIYYNIATGEKVATLVADLSTVARSGSSEVWIADNDLPCASLGQTASTVGIIDDPNCTTCFYSTSSPQIFMDWGDVSADTSVDCVGISWSSQILDTDLDGDGVGDGVDGFGASWFWYDAENGFDSGATRLPIMGFSMTDLPGFLGPFDPLEIATYTATIDLDADFASSLAFEIGDTDSSNGAGTSFFNPMGGVDLDSDGLVDFGYSLTYIQPGTLDLDGDGVIDGDIRDRGITAWTLVTGNGDVSSDGSTYFVETEAPRATGIEDAFDIFTDFDGDGILEPIGTFFYGGFSCDANGDGVTGDTTAYSQFYMKLYGAGSGGICGVDIAPAGAGDGVLNFFDLALYLAWYNAGDPRADLFPAGGDGSFNFFDLNLYIAAFTTGCP